MSTLPRSQQFANQTDDGVGTEFLTPEQRADAVAELLSAIAIRLSKQRHEQEHQG